MYRRLQFTRFNYEEDSLDGDPFVNQSRSDAYAIVGISKLASSCDATIDVSRSENSRVPVV